MICQGGFSERSLASIRCLPVCHSDSVGALATNLLLVTFAGGRKPNLFSCQRTLRFILPGNHLFVFRQRDILLEFGRECALVRRRRNESFNDSPVSRTSMLMLSLVKMLSALRRWIRRNARLLARLLLAALFACPGASAAEVDVSQLPPAANRKVDFVKDIQPILSKSCYECHGEKKQEAMLRWDAKEIALKGSERGPVIVQGKSAQSVMIHLVAGLKGEH